MRKPLMAAALLATTVFGVGYLFGQVRGPAASSAANATPIQSQPSQSQPVAPSHGAWGNLGPRADGTVTAINGDTITVKKDSDQGQTGEYGGVTTIVLSGSTTYQADHDSSTTATKSSIKVGSYLIAEGTLSADGTSLKAAQVSVRPNGPDARGSGAGAPAFYAPDNGNAAPSA